MLDTLAAYLPPHLLLLAVLIWLVLQLYVMYCQRVDMTVIKNHLERIAARLHR